LIHYHSPAEAWKATTQYELAYEDDSLDESIQINNPSAEPILGQVAKARVKELEETIFRSRSCGRTKANKHGPLTPWQWAELSLKREEKTRESIVPLSLPLAYYFSKTMRPRHCLHLSFRIRGAGLTVPNRWLYLSAVFRECDMLTDFLFDVPYFCGLLPRMQKALASHYPNLGLGTFTLFAHSLYVSDRTRAKELLG
jgi:hypothetical protein